MHRRPYQATVSLGDPDGLIAVFLDERSAFDMAHTYGPGDSFQEELLNAIAEAYPVKPTLANDADAR